MNTKLTLSIERQVIRAAKKYAKAEGRSLSNIVEEYLKSVTGREVISVPNELDPLVEELSGSLKLPEGKSYDDILEEALIEKYANR